MRSKKRGSNNKFFALNLMPKWEARNGKKYVLQFKSSGCPRKLIENGSPIGINKSSKSKPWASKVVFFEILWGLEQICFLMSFGVGEKLANNLKIWRRWQTKWKWPSQTWNFRSVFVSQFCMEANNHFTTHCFSGRRLLAPGADDCRYSAFWRSSYRHHNSGFKEITGKSYRNKEMEFRGAISCVYLEHHHYP